MLTPAGEIVVVRVFGDVDLTSEHVLRAALTDARQRRPSHLIVDVAGMGFCSLRGLRLLALDRGGHDRDGPEAHHLDYMLSGIRPDIERFLRMLWPTGALPARYPTAAAAVLNAMARQREQRARLIADQTRRSDRSTLTVGHPGRFDDPFDDRLGGFADEELTVAARGGDVEAYRELARRHRARMYRSALQTLGSSPDPVDVADDIAAQLRAALAAFSEADPP